MNDGATQEQELRTPTLLLSRSMCAWIVVAAASIVWFLLATGRPLTHPDEGRYAEIPREMLASGDWVTPHLNGVAYFEKPPLQYWATAIAYRVFGINEWSARFWTLLSGWLDVALVFLLARRLWGLRTAIVAAALLASTVLHFVMGQLMTLDMAFTCLMTAMLCAFCMAQVNRGLARSTSQWWMLASWALLALATLTKGIVAIAIAGSVIGLYVLWQRDWAVLRTLRPVLGSIVFAVIAVPWFVLAARANPDFLSFFFVHEHLQRYLTDNAQRVEPWWYFLVILAVGVLPWLPQMASALLHGWRANVARGHFDVGRLLWIWCAFIFVFFSLSNSKLAPYVLPIVPVLALLTAARKSHEDVRALRFSICTMLVCAVALVGYVVFAKSLHADAFVLELVERIRFAALAFGAVALATAIACWQASRRGHTIPVLLSLSATWFIGLSMIFATLDHPALRSGRSLAAQIPPDLAAHAPIFSISTYEQTLPFYLKRTTVLVHVLRSELDFGLRYAPDRAIADRARFADLWQRLPDGIAIMPHKVYEEFRASGMPMRVIGRDRRLIAVSRQ